MIIHIYDGLVTPATETLGPNDFNGLLTFTAVGDFSAWLGAATENTPKTPYRIALRNLNMETDFIEGGDPLGKLYAALNGKYVALDLGGCAGTAIGDSTSAHVIARQNKDKIVSLVLPATLQTLGSYAFQNCVFLASLDWPFSVAGAGIGGYAFDGCSSLNSVTLPGGLESIGQYAFQNCLSLRRIGLPAALQTIGNYAFSNTALVSLDWPVAGVGAAIGARAFNSCISLTRVSLPATLTNLGDYAFSGCLQLESVHLPADFGAVIGTSAFETSLVDMTFYVPPEDGAVCRTILSGTVLVINSTVVLAVSSASGDLSLPSDITEIAPFAFQNCGSLQSVSWTSAPANAIVGSYAFDGCSGLSSVSLPDTLTGIGSYAFRNTGVVTLILPAALQSIGDYAFQNCASLQSVTWAEAPSVPTLGTYAFDGCSVLSSVRLPDNLEVIGQGTFRNCTALTEITLPGVLITIGNYAFQYAKFATLSLPSTVQTIGSYAFQYCTNLRWVKWPESPAGTLGSGGIGYVFGGCTQLERVELPNNLTNIYNSSFRECYALQVVILHGTTPPALAHVNALNTVHEDLKIYVPDSAVSAYQGATNWSTYSSKIVSVNTLTDDPSGW